MTKQLLGGLEKGYYHQLPTLDCQERSNSNVRQAKRDQSPLSTFIHSPDIYSLHLYSENLHLRRWYNTGLGKRYLETRRKHI